MPELEPVSGALDAPTADPSPTPPVTACTIVARNYLPAARVLAQSYREHHPEHRFVIAVIDAAAGDSDLGEQPDGCTVLGPESFAIDRTNYLRMATAYSLTELATAVKPYLMLGLRESADIVLYLDPDIVVFAPMPELVELARAHKVVLAPHVLRPMPRDGHEPDEAIIMGTGIFNLGFLATGPGSEDFLTFWARRLRQDAIVAPERQLFTDQRWVDQVPALFEHHVLRDPGYDVAYWNVHERAIDTAPDGTVTAGGSPLRFFHFSGYRPEKPWLLTYHCARDPRILLSDEPVLRRLCDEYAGSLRDAGYAESLAAVPYGYATLADGTELTPTMRRLFRDEWVAAEHSRPSPGGAATETPPHAFGSDGGLAFAEWLASPATRQQSSAGLNRLAMSIWEQRTDLRMAFPDPCGSDAEGFRRWCSDSGVSEHQLPQWVLPGAKARQPFPPSTEFGVNVLGYLTAELGLGEMGRIVHDAIDAAEVPMASVVEDGALSNRTAVRHPDTVAEPRFGVSLLCVNADQTSLILQRHPEIGEGRYRIGLWAWELEEFPEWLHTEFDLVDEVWTVSDFCARAIRAHSTVPVHTFPVPVADPGAAERERDAGAPVRFLFAFDFNSVGERKNPWGVVEAFHRAFGDRGNVRLTIKAINGSNHPHAAERLRVAIDRDARIELLEHYLSADELHALYNRSDCYVSLHRSEGFGLTVAEAMARGLPVIATDYSGSTEFLDERGGWPVPYRMTHVGKGCFPYQEGAIWAEPDLDVAAAAMRTVADDPEEAAARGAAGRERLLGERTRSVAVDWLRERLHTAHATWLDRREHHAETAPDPLAPVRDAEQALHWRPDPGDSARNPLAPAARKLVLRAIDHYDAYNRRVLGTLKHGTDEVLETMLARIEALERRAETAEAESRMRSAGLRALDDTVAGLQRDTPRALRDLGADVAELREATRGEIGARERLDESLGDARRDVHERFTARDRRHDQNEHVLAEVNRKLAAVNLGASLRHAPLPRGTEVVSCDAGVLLLPFDDVLLPALIHDRSWEAAEADLMTELADGGTFLDVGAHAGYHTLRLLASGAAIDRVVAVEANPDTAGLLRRNVAVNVPADSDLVTVLHAAAWDTEGEVRIAQVETGNSGDFRVRAQGPDGVAVPAVRLDGVTAVTSSRVSLVKVDLQGRDHRALAGLSEVLRRDRPHVVCEFSPESISELGDDPMKVLAGYREFGYRPIPLGAADEPVDSEIVRRADATDARYLTLRLLP